MMRLQCWIARELAQSERAHFRRPPHNNTDKADFFSLSLSDGFFERRNFVYFSSLHLDPLLLNKLSVSEMQQL